MCGYDFENIDMWAARGIVIVYLRDKHLSAKIKDKEKEKVRQF